VPGREVPLIVIGSRCTALADSVAAQLRDEGNVVYVTHSPEGCLRVATSVAPDVILLDAEFPGRVEKLLKVHPASARARILHLSDDPPNVGARRLRPALTVGPHAA
jgi:CheY-like chemotaxis protein